ncbi:MAG: hypothetical protein ACAI35_16820 [Candidatus Methylacidiphilales bacterium]
MGQLGHRVQRRWRCFARTRR